MINKSLVLLLNFLHANFGFYLKRSIELYGLKSFRYRKFGSGKVFNTQKRAIQQQQISHRFNFVCMSADRIKASLVGYYFRLPEDFLL